ncbi:unnamed protein product [Prorocentrum cordatum]|uniref:C3H1-type domain-containing protein n=1 Tax=Prorocentrum cordatum TaxID=2364126 RepID=A0ABN9WUN8_9DINO|nr:unnamed protein product [Polarella glacialis]
MSQAFSIKNALEAFWSKNTPEEKDTLKGKEVTRKRQTSQAQQSESPGRSEPRADARTSGTTGGQSGRDGPRFKPYIRGNKTLLCLFFNSKRGCRYGEECKFVHQKAKPVQMRAQRERSPSRSQPPSSSSPGGRGSPHGRPGRSGGVVTGRRSRSRRIGGRARGRGTNASPGLEAAKRQVLQERRQRARSGTSSTSSASSAGSRRRQSGAGKGSRRVSRKRRGSSSSSSSGGAQRGRSGSIRRDGTAQARRKAAAPAPHAAEAPATARALPEGKPEGAGGDKKAKVSKWDLEPTAQMMKEQLEVQKKSFFGLGGVKTREVYVGNLPYNVVQPDRLRLAFVTLFRELPAYQETYPDVADPIAVLTMGHAGSGSYSFVEFRDPVMASTAMLFSGFELCGRSLGIGRPGAYVPPPGGDAKALDVTPLRQRGLLPKAPTNAMYSQKEAKLRELYFGNLVRSKTTPEAIQKLVDPVAQQLKEWRAETGPAITNINMCADGAYAFVQFQSIDLATKIMQIFDGQEVFGRPLRIRRTNTYETEKAKAGPLEQQAMEALQAMMPDKVASTSRVAPFLMPPPPPGPPPNTVTLPPQLEVAPAPAEVQALGERQLLESMSMTAQAALRAPPAAEAAEHAANRAPAPPTAMPPTDPLAMLPLPGARTLVTVAPSPPPPGAPMQLPDATAHSTAEAPPIPAAEFAKAAPREATLAEPLAMSSPTRAPEQPAAVEAPPPPPSESTQAFAAASPAIAPPTTTSTQEVPQAKLPPQAAAPQMLAPLATTVPPATALAPPITVETPQNPDTLHGMLHGEGAEAEASVSPPRLTSPTAL